MSERTEDVEGRIVEVKRLKNGSTDHLLDLLERGGESDLIVENLRARFDALRSERDEAREVAQRLFDASVDQGTKLIAAEAALSRKDAEIREASNGMEMNLAEARAKINAARDDRADDQWREGVLVEARDAVDHAIERLRALASEPGQEGGDDGE